jgi:hypothetical protein
MDMETSKSPGSSPQTIAKSRRAGICRSRRSCETEDNACCETKCIEQPFAHRFLSSCGDATRTVRQE